MKKLLVLLCPLLLSASGFDERSLGSAYGFDYGRGRDWDTDIGTYLYIDGPVGKEVFEFGFDTGVGSLLITPSGMLVGRGDPTDDVFLFFAQYSDPAPATPLHRLGSSPNFGTFPCPGPSANPNAVIMNFDCNIVAFPDGSYGFSIWQHYSDSSSARFAVLPSPVTSSLSPAPSPAVISLTTSAETASFMPAFTTVDPAPEPSTLLLTVGALLIAVWRGPFRVHQ